MNSKISSHKTVNLKVNQQTPKPFEKYLSYFEAMASKDLENYGSFLTEDAEMCGLTTICVAKENCRFKGSRRLLEKICDHRHDLTNIYGTVENYALEALNHYQRHDGKNVTVRPRCCAYGCEQCQKGKIDQTLLWIITKVFNYETATPVIRYIW